MGAISWKNPGTSGDWSNAGHWKPFGVPQPGDIVTLGASNSKSYTVTVDSTVDIASLTITGDASGSTHAVTLEIEPGHSLTTSGAIFLSNSQSFITGAGTLTAHGGISGSGTITANGGTLDVFGSINGVKLAIGNAAGSTLKIEGDATSSAISIGHAGQMLEIGGSGSLTITTAESITKGTIKLDGGDLTFLGAGLTLGSGSQLIGHGTVTGNVNGPSALSHGSAGSITAAGGTLEFKSAVDTASGFFNLPSRALTFHIASDGTLKFDGAVGTAAIKPTIIFDAASGVLDLSGISSETSKFHGTICGFKSGDQIKFADACAGPLSYTTSFSGGITTVTIKDGTTTVGTVALSGNYTAAHFSLSESGHIDTLTTDAACFMAGTMVRTPDGEVAVETLKRGDLVLSSDGQARPVSWLGVQTIATRFADKMRVWPIRIAAGALAENVPSRDLLLSPDHAVLVEGALVQAGALVNGTSIVRETDVPDVFIYYHVELDDHSLILAENTPAETFVDNVDRLNFDNWAEHEALYPEGRPIAELPYPRAKSRRQVAVSTRVMLAARAQAIGAADAPSAVVA